MQLRRRASALLTEAAVTGLLPARWKLPATGTAGKGGTSGTSNRN